MKSPFSIYFAGNVVIDNRYPEKICILPDCTFAPFSVVLSHSFVPKGNTVVGDKEIVRETYIGRGVFIGAHAVILPGTSWGLLLCCSWLYSVWNVHIEYFDCRQSCSC